MDEKTQHIAAQRFADAWKGRGYEKGDSQLFWIDLLTNVLGVKNCTGFISFEDQVKLDHTSFIDAYIDSSKVLIEQKSIDKDLRAAIRQSDGTLLTPFQQAKRYITEMPVSKHPRWVVTCNFKSFLVYDMEQPNCEPEEILLENLPKEVYRLSFLIDNGNEHLKREMEVSIAAGDIVGLLYNALYKQYKNPDNPHSQKSLNKLCVRLVFCLYAEDAGIFGRHGMFHDYLNEIQTHDIRKALINLFNTLDTKSEDRDPYLADDNPTLAAFPYVNGGLFADEDIEIPPFTDEIKKLLLEKASADFDWSEISPTIFGAVFESTLNPETRRSGGMHYTSIENIHKVIDPLFLNDLKRELTQIRQIPVEKTRNQKLSNFQKKLSELTFLDPACGSGNFLTESYLCLRRLENEILRIFTNGQTAFLSEEYSPIQVSIQQFYGIEINDFAVAVAKTALWIAESQMKRETEDIVVTDLDYLPLQSYINIKEGNALQMDWNTVVPKEQLNYIMGNPPFVGARIMNSIQKADVNAIFKGWRNAGNLDYVACWYKKACDMMKGTSIHTAFVSTNSITQGEQVAILWKPLMNEGIAIHFAYCTFRWDSEANDKAHVHCVIIGFSACEDADKDKILYPSEKQYFIAQNINPYLVDAENVFVESRQKPLCDVPEIGIGNKPIDDGNYLFTKDEMEEFIKREPAAQKYFKPWYGSREFINQSPRYCLWLGNCPPDELRRMPEAKKRVEAVRNFRLANKSPGTVKLADTPTRFHVENMPNSTYIIIPRVSSEKRRYVPIGFLNPSILTSDSAHIIPNATLYHFGVLTSNVHNAWMRVVCGRLESRYRYSKDIVYNNFPWPSLTPEQKARIGQTAQAVLDARNLFPDSSLADLYDEITMPPELRKAHQENDRAVMLAYGFNPKMTESECVGALFEMYQKLTQQGY